MLLPFRRDRLAARAALDAAAEREQCRVESPGDRLALSAGLSDLARSLGRAVQADWVTAPAADLAQKPSSGPGLFASWRGDDPRARHRSAPGLLAWARRLHESIGTGEVTESIRLALADR